MCGTCFPFKNYFTEALPGVRDQKWTHQLRSICDPSWTSTLLESRQIPLSYENPITPRLDIASLNPTSFPLSQYKNPPRAPFSKVYRIIRREVWGAGDVRWAGRGGRRKEKGKADDASVPGSALHSRSPGSDVLNGIHESIFYLLFLHYNECFKKSSWSQETGWRWAIVFTTRQDARDTRVSKTYSWLPTSAVWSKT